VIEKDGEHLLGLYLDLVETGEVKAFVLTEEDDPKEKVVAEGLPEILNFLGRRVS